MARYKMTAKRRAALRKAQLASARKRRKGGVKRRAKRLGRNVNREYARKTAYAKKHYSGRGGMHRKHKDMARSRGAYKNNWRGKRYGRTARVVNRGAGAFLMANPGYAAPILASKYRGRKRKKR